MTVYGGIKVNERILKKISEIIIDYAKNHEVIEYNQISKKLGGAISPIRLNEPLGEISFRCIKHGFPPLSAIVVNQDTRLPGEGFFTWVAAKMGYPNLAPSKWDEFYKEQKERVFNCDDWAAFLQTAFTSEPKMGTPSNKINLNDILLAKDYVKGKRTQYNILTVKAFNDTQQNGPFQYHVLVLEQDKLVNQGTVEDNLKKQLLTPAKRKGIQLLLNYNSTIKIDNITMVHYKPDRPSQDLWEKEPMTSLEALFLEERSLFINQIVENDIDSEKAQEDSYYKDGKVTEYYGIRYERNPINRAKAIEIHGVTCKACGFNFEKVYGERGKNFIEVHHVKPLHSIGEEIDINPETDLVPVCSNCHRMIHRKKDVILSVDEIREIVLKNLTEAK
jgi:predicted HNH restriction endonuclease